MSNPFDFFDAMYCINLDSRPDRWETVQAEFKKLGIQDRVERVPGVLNKLEGHKGCRDAQINCIKKAKESGLENIFIFEDDVLVLETDMTYYEKLIDALKNTREWHMFFLSATIWRTPAVYNDYLFYAERLLALHAYAVHSSMFDSILKDYNNGIIKIVDIYYRSHIQTMNKSFLANRFCCTQADGYSDIKNRDAQRSFIERRYNKFILDVFRDKLV